MMTLRSILPIIALATSCASAPSPCPSAPVLPPPVPVESATATAPEPSPAPVEVAPSLVLSRSNFDELQGWSEDQHGEALSSLNNSCRRLLKRPDDRELGKNPAGGTVADWRPLCAAANRLSPAKHEDARAFFEQHFVPYRAANHSEAEGMFTGYYEAKMRGSRKRHGAYQTPLYGRPKDVITLHLDEFTKDGKGRILAGRLIGRRLRPYHTRKEIDEGALAGRRLELLWVDNPVDAFFTEIQGSGVVELDDGSTVRVGYAGKNGRPYTAIGRVLVERGELSRAEASMQGIRAWIEQNPARATALMQENASYVFFELSQRTGAVGSQNVVLSPERSVAVDREFIALSTPIWLETEVPVAHRDEERPFRQLVIAQDTGGAIKGPVRGDIFWGASDDAADVAGRLKGKGIYYLLIPKPIAERIGPSHQHPAATTSD